MNSARNSGKVKSAATWDWTVTAATYLICLTSESAGEVRTRKIRAMLIQKELLEKLPEYEPKFESPNHATRWMTLKFLAKEFQVNPAQVSCRRNLRLTSAWMIRCFIEAGVRLRTDSISRRSELLELAAKGRQELPVFKSRKPGKRVQRFPFQLDRLLGRPGLKARLRGRIENRGSPADRPTLAVPVPGRAADHGATYRPTSNRATRDH